MPEQADNTAMYKKYGSLRIRKMQRHLSSKGTIPTVEGVSSALAEEDRKTKSRGLGGRKRK